LDLRKKVGRNLKALIKARGYRTLELFAHENGFSKSWVARIVRGDVDPKFTSMIRLAKALDADLLDLHPGRKKK